MDARQSLPVERASNFRQISACLIELNKESGDELYRGFLPVVGVAHMDTIWIQMGVKQKKVSRAYFMTVDVIYSTDNADVFHSFFCSLSSIVL